MNWEIILSPLCVDAPEPLSLSVNGAVLTANGAALDLSLLADGDTLPSGAIEHPLFLGAEIHRHGGLIEVYGLQFPISLNQTDSAACFPEPITVTGDGPIPLPPQFPPEPEPAPQPEQPEEPNADQH